MKNWNRADANACVHAIIEPDGDVYQILLWKHRGWHCGGGANNTHIGVEMTEPSTIKYAGGASWTETGDGENTKAHVLAAYQYAVELFAYLCEQFRLDPLADGVRGDIAFAQSCLETGNFTFSGSAAGEKYGEKILSILKAIMEEGKVQFMESLILSAPYMVRVSIPDLNIRRGPGTSYPKTGKFTGVGISPLSRKRTAGGC